MTEIQLSHEFSEEFAGLQKRAENGEGEAEQLIKLIDKGIAKLIENHEAGQKIQKKLWPKYYTQKYGITPVETKAGQFLENDLHDNRRAGQDCRSHPRGHEPQGL